MAKLIFPREHGAWAMLGVPFIVGWGLGGFRINIAVVLTACLVLSLFLARYPLTLLVKYPKRQHLYKSSLLTYLGVGVVALLPLLALYRLIWLIPLGATAMLLLALNLLLTARGQERSITANLLGITGLCLNGPLGYYVSTGTLNSLALVIWVLCALFFGSSLFYVKMLFRESKNRYFRELALLVHLIALILVLAAGEMGLVPSVLALAFFLPLLKVLLALWRSKTPSLKQVGFSELALSLIFLTVFFFSYI